MVAFNPSPSESGASAILATTFRVSSVAPTTVFHKSNLNGDPPFLGALAHAQPDGHPAFFPVANMSALAQIEASVLDLHLCTSLAFTTDEVREYVRTKRYWTLTPESRAMLQRKLARVFGRSENRGRRPVGHISFSRGIDLHKHVGRLRRVFRFLTSLVAQNDAYRSDSAKENPRASSPIKAQNVGRSHQRHDRGTVV